MEGKNEKEVSKYAATFFQRFVEIKEWEKLMKKIEQGEARIQRRLDMGSAFQKKCARHPDHRKCSCSKYSHSKAEPMYFLGARATRTPSSRSASITKRTPPTAGPEYI